MTYLKAYQYTNYENFFSNSLFLRSLVVGILGSVAYYSAVYFGFISSNINDTRMEKGDVLKNRNKFNKIKNSDYFITIMGGFVAATVQILYGESFSPLQAFIIGSIWPSYLVIVPSILKKIYKNCLWRVGFQ